MKKESGFTLVELLVTLLVGVIMMAAIYGAINAAQRSSTGIERRVVAQQDARVALELMAMEIRMASCNPSLVTNIWVDATSCSGTAANQIARGIQEATANSIAIEMDIAGSLVVGYPADGIIDDPNEIIRYAYNASNKMVTRSTNCGGNQPFLGATNVAADTKTVLVENNAAGVPLFRYYDGSGTELAAPVVNLQDIRVVEITLVVDMQHGDLGTGTRRRVVYSTSVIPRNHIPVQTYN